MHDLEAVARGVDKGGGAGDAAVGPTSAPFDAIDGEEACLVKVVRLGDSVCAGAFVGANLELNLGLEGGNADGAGVRGVNLACAASDESACLGAVLHVSGDLETLQVHDQSVVVRLCAEESLGIEGSVRGEGVSTNLLSPRSSPPLVLSSPLSLSRPLSLPTHKRLDVVSGEAGSPMLDVGDDVGLLRGAERVPLDDKVLGERCVGSGQRKHEERACETAEEGGPHAAPWSGLAGVVGAEREVENASRIHLHRSPSARAGSFVAEPEHFQFSGGMRYVRSQWRVFRFTRRE